MKRLTAIALAFLFTAPVAAEEVDRTLNAASDGAVEVSNIAGSVTVEGWSRDEVQVKGTLGPNVEELIFERDGDRVTIKVKVPKRGGRGIDSDLRISIPRGSSIDIATVSADIDVNDVLGEQELEAVSGDINTEAFESDLRAGTVSGDVYVKGDGKDTETRGNTVSGDVTLKNMAGQVAAESVSGDVIIDGGSFDRAEFSTVNGEVGLQFEGKVSGRFDVDTFNGDIDNCFGPKPERTSKYAPGQELSFQEGNGDARINVSTMNGDISICR